MTTLCRQWRRNEFESGAGTGPERKWGPRTEKNFGCAPPLFGSKSTISRFGERFRGGQCSLVSLLFAVFLLTIPPVPSHCKSVGTCPRAPWSRRHCLSLTVPGAWMMYRHRSAVLMQLSRLWVRPFRGYSLSHCRRICHNIVHSSERSF